MSLYARMDYETVGSQVVLIGLPEDMPKWEEFIQRMERWEQEWLQQAKQRTQELMQQMEQQKQRRGITN